MLFFSFVTWNFFSGLYVCIQRNQGMNLAICKTTLFYINILKFGSISVYLNINVHKGNLLKMLRNLKTYTFLYCTDWNSLLKFCFLCVQVGHVWSFVHEINLLVLVYGGTDGLSILTAFNSYNRNWSIADWIWLSHKHHTN